MITQRFATPIGSCVCTTNTVRWRKWRRPHTHHPSFLFFFHSQRLGAFCDFVRLCLSLYNAYRYTEGLQAKPLSYTINMLFDPKKTRCHAHYSSQARKKWGKKKQWKSRRYHASHRLESQARRAAPPFFPAVSHPLPSLSLWGKS